MREQEYGFKLVKWFHVGMAILGASTLAAIAVFVVFALAPSLR